MASAAFSINTTTVPAAVSVAYGGAVALALLSTTGVATVSWRIAGSSKSTYTNPTITAAGVPSGATASCTHIADPGTGLGASFLVECTVTDSNGATYVQTGVFGTANTAGKIPIASNEMAGRSATHGWVESLNQAMAAPQIILTGTVTHDFGSIASDSYDTTLTTIGTGLLATDKVDVWATTPLSLLFFGYYYSATQIMIEVRNYTAGAVDPASVTLYYRVTR